MALGLKDAVGGGVRTVMNCPAWRLDPVALLAVSLTMYVPAAA
jgi:hypothetical protein